MYSKYKRLVLVNPANVRNSPIPLPKSLTARPRTYATATQTQACPNCSTPISKLTVARCPICTAILPPPPQDSTTFYDLFDLPRSFNVNRTELKRKFLSWQQRVHPDSVGQTGMEESTRWARDWSGLINGAYKTLELDLARAEYLVGLFLVILTARLEPIICGH